MEERAFCCPATFVAILFCRHDATAAAAKARKAFEAAAMPREKYKLSVACGNFRFGTFRLWVDYSGDGATHSRYE